MGSSNVKRKTTGYGTSSSLPDFPVGVVWLGCVLCVVHVAVECRTKSFKLHFNVSCTGNSYVHKLHDKPEMEAQRLSN